MSDEKTFKILSIDGGGIKGLYSLYVLREFEGRFCKEGETLSDYFDLICGTSTGGLIALGIATGHRVQEIIDLYEKNVSVIFSRSDYWWPVQKVVNIYRGVAQLFGTRYSNVGLASKLDSFFGNLTLEDSRNLLCIPSFQLGTKMNVVFKCPYNATMVRDGRISMRDVALATTSAPTYFAPHHLQTPHLGGYLVDGGVWANDPSLAGIIEALNSFVGGPATTPGNELGFRYTGYEVLSIGNVRASTQPPVTAPDQYWNILKFNSLIDLFMDGNENSIRHYCYVLCKATNGRLFRVEKTDYPYPDDVRMDNSDPRFLESLATFGKSDGVRYGAMDEVARFFATRKTYRTRWQDRGPIDDVGL